MERPSYEIVFSITLLKSREHKLILIFQEIANKQKISHYYLYVTRNSCATED